jgi:hypothetical protein
MLPGGLLSMNRYYFHMRDEHGLIEDTDGIELPSLHALLTEVYRSADEFLREAQARCAMRFEIADAEGRTILVMPLDTDTPPGRSLVERAITSNHVH